MFNRLPTVLKRHKVILLSLTITLIAAIFTKAVLVDIVYVNHQFEKKRIITPWGEKLKSGNLSVDYTMEQTLSDIERLGLNTVNVPVEIDIPSLTANSMSINPESKTKAIQLIKKLRYRGINVILEPFPFIQKGELYETNLQPADLNEWFRNWKQGVLSPLILDIAKPYKVYAVCIGSNFDQFENQYGYWSEVADFVRANYKGKITYRTNWWYTAEWNSNKDSKDDTYTVKLNNPLLGKLDFISVAAYFELTDKDTNSVANLVSALHGTQIFKRNQDIYSELKNLSSKWHKPLFFGELGFPKRNQASVHPWNPVPSNLENDLEQANCFQAYKEVFEKETWNLGFSVFAIGKDDATKNYYPSNLSAEIIKNWYS
ncbi:hydrolase [Desulfosporosinus sp. PR]|uniref:glycoside hydrolase family 113 n=1 Tax=Candidatus Desulfosporosinus nitrosoreducens TaxID=3401928 RepID=UPI0027FABA79|nr:hydrolase [Desulfosporosinus sp. PR]MDQ7095708.1 hydrolase [Desulfosporosinus sp. PR]